MRHQLKEQNIKKIAVVGICGSGKSTLARKISQNMNLPLIHLDQEYWNPGWVATEEAVWCQKHRKLINRESWVIDGNFRGTLEERIQAADAVVLLDFSRAAALRGVLKRIITTYGRVRTDMGKGCPERFDRSFLVYVWNFPKKQRLENLQVINRYPEKMVIVLKSRREVRRFLRNLAKS